KRVTSAIRPMHAQGRIEAASTDLNAGRIGVLPTVFESGSSHLGTGVAGFCSRFAELPFPFGDDRGSDAVADHVGRGAAHVEELVDPPDQQTTGLRKPDERQYHS